jgi:hypothetical protein
VGDRGHAPLPPAAPGEGTRPPTAGARSLGAKSYAAVARGTKKPCFDSGATSTMHNRAEVFTGLKKKRGRVYLGDNSPIPSLGSGQAEGVGRALLVPLLDRALISTGQDDLDGYHTVFGKGVVRVVTKEPIIPPGAKVVRCGKLAGSGLYELSDLTRESATKKREMATPAMESGLEQNRFHLLTHYPAAKTNRMINHKTALGLPVEHLKEEEPCDGCMQGRMRRPTVKRKGSGETEEKEPGGIFSIVGLDLVDLGPKAGKRRWMGVFHDQGVGGSDHTWLYYGPSKKSFRDRMLLPFLAEVARLRKKVDTLQSDAEAIYWDPTTRARHLKGIGLRKSAPYIKEQNGGYGKGADHSC